MAEIKARIGRRGYTDATHSRALVRFHSDQNPRREVIEVGADAGPSELLGRLVSVQTHKGFDGASGNFTIVCKKPPLMHRQQSLLRLWREPEDVWVEIFYVVEGQRIHRMTGLVDAMNVSEVRVEGGRRVEVYRITGRDVGKLFETTELWFNNYVPGGDSALPKSIVAAMDSFVQKAPLNRPPGDWIKWILETWFGNKGLALQQWAMPQSLGGSSFYDRLDLTNIEQPPDGSDGRLGVLDGVMFSPDAVNGLGQLWPYLQSYSNDFLNELWIDLVGTGEGQRPFGIYLRERPFPTFRSRRVRWEAIEYHVLEKYDVQSRELSKGGAANRYNFWSIVPDGKEFPQDMRYFLSQAQLDAAPFGFPGNIPIWNNESIQRHGLRRWEKSTIWLNALVEKGDGPWATMAANWLRKAHDWYAVAPMQLSGEITCSRLLPEIRIGSRIVERRDEGDVEYYCEGVDDEWYYPGAGHTTLTVTRGQYVQDNLLQAVYEQMLHPTMPTHLRDCVPGGDVVDAILQQCKYVPQSAENPGEKILTHGGAGFDVLNIPDQSRLEQVGASLISQGADPGSARQPARSLPATVEQQQASEIDRGVPNPQLRRPPGQPFDKAALDRGEDPLAGYDVDIDNDPIAGIGP